MIRYKIATVASAKATGGAISFYNDKTIHTFTTTGDFNNTTGSDLTGCEVIILGRVVVRYVARGGGGGAGRFYRNDDVTIGSGPNPVTIGAGGNGATNGPNAGGVGSTGSASVFNSVTMPGGAGGAHYGTPATAGGSGGGASYGPPSNPGAAPPGNVVAVVNTDTPANGAGNAGGAGTGSPQGSKPVVVVPVELVVLVSIPVHKVDLVDWVFSCHLHSRILLQELDILREILHHLTLLLVVAVVVLEVHLPYLVEVVVVSQWFQDQIKDQVCLLLTYPHMSGLVQDRVLLIQVLRQEMPKKTLDLVVVDQEMDILLLPNMVVMVVLVLSSSHTQPDKYLKT